MNLILQGGCENKIDMKCLLCFDRSGIMTECFVIQTSFQN